VRVRGLIVILLAMLAARMARRALKHGAGQYAEIMAALFQVTGMLLAASAANTAKARNVEDRLNALVPRVPFPQAAPGTSAGGTAAGTNSSYDMGGGLGITYNSGSGNQGGGPGSSTSGQIGGASAHYHDMTHFHTNSTDLQSAFNALRDSHSALVPAFNNLVNDHAQLITDHNSLKVALVNSGILH